MIRNIIASGTKGTLGRAMDDVISKLDGITKELCEKEQAEAKYGMMVMAELLPNYKITNIATGKGHDMNDYYSIITISADTEIWEKYDDLQV